MSKMFPRIFEIFGYPIDDKSAEAEQVRQSAQCPFMARDCDGGGNRYLSGVVLSTSGPLQAYFPARSTIVPGICSLQLQPNKPPWIVCPRRLLVLGRERSGQRRRQQNTEFEVLRYLDYPTGTQLGVWSEVKLIHQEQVGGAKKKFDYTFDYVLVPVGRASQSAIETATGVTWSSIRGILTANGYTLTKIGADYFVEDFPIGTPSIIEIMTSSTSGGNRDVRSTIPLAFEDAILGRQHSAPGINYRQVWARMVSQLLVKSEVALRWGGRTVWIVQDVLIDYISSSTALNVHQFLSNHTSDVNLLSFSYGSSHTNPQGVLELSDPKLYAGPLAPISSDNEDIQASFMDIIRTPVHVPLSRLLLLLARKKPLNYVSAP